MMVWAAEVPEGSPVPQGNFPGGLRVLTQQVNKFNGGGVVGAGDNDALGVFHDYLSIPR